MSETQRGAGEAQPEWQYERYELKPAIPIGSGDYTPWSIAHYRRAGEILQRMVVVRPEAAKKYREQYLSGQQISQFTELFDDWEIYIEQNWNAAEGVMVEPNFKIVGWVDTSSEEEQALYRAAQADHQEIQELTR
jgi:hypothetical protein